MTQREPDEMERRLSGMREKSAQRAEQWEAMKAGALAAAPESTDDEAPTSTLTPTDQEADPE